VILPPSTTAPSVSSTLTPTVSDRYSVGCDAPIKLIESCIITGTSILLNSVTIEFTLVTLIGEKIGVAKHIDQNKTAVGLIRESVVSGQSTNYFTKGFISNENWNFSVNPGTLLFCGNNGQVTINVPQSGFLQQVGHVVNNNTIFLNIERPIFYDSI